MTIDEQYRQIMKTAPSFAAGMLACLDAGMPFDTTDDTLAYLRADAGFCQTHRCQTASKATADLWGFGDVTLAFVAKDEDDDPDQAWWVWLYDLTEATGCTREQLTDFWNRDRADGYADVDVVTYTRPSEDRPISVPIVGNGAVMRVFMEISPWGAEFMKNMRPVFAHAFMASGMAELVGGAPSYVIDQNSLGEDVAVPTGRTLGDHIRTEAGQTSDDEAAQQAFRGPTGPLTDD